MRVLSALSVLVALSSCTSAKMVQATYWPAYDGINPVSTVAWNVTNIAYYFVLETTQTGIVMPEGQTVNDLKALVKKAHETDTKAVFTVGGWDGGLYFSDLVSTATKRAAFAKTLHEWVEKYEGDGIDIDWEYPNSQGIGCNTIRDDDTANFLLFLRELRSLMGEDKIITAATSITPFNGPDGTPLADVSEFAKYLSYINLMVYDLTGTWDSSSASSSPLGTPKSDCGSDGSAHSAVAAWEAAGFPSHQIILGIPTYATGLTTLSDKLEVTEVDGYETKVIQAISDVVPKGDSTDTTGGTDVCGNAETYSGEYTYKELITEGILGSNGKEGKNGYVRHWDTCSQTPFLFNADKKHFITYEDLESASQKARWAHLKGLAGIQTFDSDGWDDAMFVEVHAALYEPKSDFEHKPTRHRRTRRMRR